MRFTAASRHLRSSLTSSNATGRLSSGGREIEHQPGHVINAGAAGNHVGLVGFYRVREADDCRGVCFLRFATPEATRRFSGLLITHDAPAVGWCRIVSQSDPLFDLAALTIGQADDPDPPPPAFRR